jgi:hypothetical protein
VTTELSEVNRINAKSVSVIFDSERSSDGAPLSAKFSGFKKQCEDLKWEVFDTDYHSSENYITQAAIEAVFPTIKYRALNPYEKRPDGEDHWHKADNWLLFKEMNKEDFLKTGLGQFIQNQLVPLASR